MNKWQKLNERDKALKQQVKRGLIIGWLFVGMTLCFLTLIALSLVK